MRGDGRRPLVVGHGSIDGYAGWGVDARALPMPFPDPGSSVHALHAAARTGHAQYAYYA